MNTLDQQQRKDHISISVMLLSVCVGLLLLTGFARAAEKRIAITFDDAPRADSAFHSGEDRTKALISALKVAGVKQAAFFVVTNKLNQPGDFARIEAYAASGHVIANHSDTHHYLRRSDLGDYLADIDSAEQKLDVFANRRPWFRFPYLDEGRDIETHKGAIDGLADRGMMNGYVTIDNYDWYLDHLGNTARRDGVRIDESALAELYVETIVQGVEFYDSIAREWYGRSPAHVLLLHENDLSALFLPDLIARLRDDGWEIITADEAYEDPIADLAPRTVFNGQGRIGAIAHALGAQPRDLVHEREDEAVLDELFATHVINNCEGERP